ncbi:hypothetical protein MVEN_01069900 [Mycena venus]|uniref:F-box domain-containing protein n=1 Tax=Mycena venus TaxID=2733690 RepID=A0A8H6Y5V9_9AGAR|nr:hypothetical protein MVEN_01069900 [Mycena venus]
MLSGLLRKCTFTQLVPESNPNTITITHLLLEELTLEEWAPDVLRFLDLPALHALSLNRLSFSEPPLRFLRYSPVLRTFAYDAKVTFERDVDSCYVISLDWFRATKRSPLSNSATSQQAPYTFLLALARHRRGFPSASRSLEMVRDQDHTVHAADIAAWWSRLSVSPSSAVRLAHLRLVSSFCQYTLGWDELGDLDWDGQWDLAEEGMVICVGRGQRNCLFEWWISISSIRMCTHPYCYSEIIFATVSGVMPENVPSS